MPQFHKYSCPFFAEWSMRRFNRISYIPSLWIISSMVRKSSLKYEELLSIWMSMWTERRIRNISYDWSSPSCNLIPSTFKNISNYSWHWWWRWYYFTIFHKDCFAEILIELDILLIFCKHITSLIYCENYYNLLS